MPEHTSLEDMVWGVVVQGIDTRRIEKGRTGEVPEWGATAPGVATV
jgi:hypothetical protein